MTQSILSVLGAKGSTVSRPALFQKTLALHLIASCFSGAYWAIGFEVNFVKFRYGS